MSKETSAKVEGGYLVIKVPLNDPPRPSGTGKTLVVASTYGNQQTDLEIQGERVTVGVNAYIKRPR